MRWSLAGLLTCASCVADPNLAAVDLAALDLLVSPDLQPLAREDCLNGVDDNDDGLIDCADPLCGEFEWPRTVVMLRSVSWWTLSPLAPMDICGSRRYVKASFRPGAAVADAMSGPTVSIEYSSSATAPAGLYYLRATTRPRTTTTT